MNSRINDDNDGINRKPFPMLAWNLSILTRRGAKSFYLLLDTQESIRSFRSLALLSSSRGTQRGIRKLQKAKGLLSVVNTHRKLTKGLHF